MTAFGSLELNGCLWICFSPWEYIWEHWMIQRGERTVVFRDGYGSYDPGHCDFSVIWRDSWQLWMPAGSHRWARAVYFCSKFAFPKVYAQSPLRRWRGLGVKGPAWRHVGNDCQGQYLNPCHLSPSLSDFLFCHNVPDISLGMRTSSVKLKTDRYI